MSKASQQLERREVWYYVETSIEDASKEMPADRVRFRAHLTMAYTPKLAERDAVEDDEASNPGCKVEPFLTRRLKDSKANAILRAFDRGTWEGWFEQGSE